MDFYPERDILLHKKFVKDLASAYVNIMQGCDNFCAYCIVPYTRGRQKSRKSVKIIEECERLVDAGIKEITLLGQNVNSYGKDKYGDGVSFEDLLKRISKIQGLKRIRFTTSHPKDISDELISLFGKLENLCPAIHLPLQSGSNRILKKMGRKYQREEYLTIIKKLRNVRKDIVITTDIIVGFPSETEEDFEDTLNLIKQVKFDSSFSFKYSDRPGTRASKMQPKIPEPVKAERLKKLQTLQDELTIKSMEKLKDKVVEVLIEGISSKQFEKEKLSYRGREPGNRVVNFLVDKEKNKNIGEFVQVKITQIKKHSLFGEVIK
jgi:tRNA-2-methylthio-N6-dimethylallyladenosine synthase